MWVLGSCNYCTFYLLTGNVVLTWRGNSTAWTLWFHSKSCHVASIYSIFTSRRRASAIYWPLNRVSMETPGCLTNLLSWTMAEVISPSHKAGKHLCVQRQEKNEDSLPENWERDWGKKWKFHWRGYRGSQNGGKKALWNCILLYCPNKLRQAATV